MTKELWLNLPVKNLAKAKKFFNKIGFAFNEKSPGNTETSAPMMIGSKNIVVMLFEESVFKHICGNSIADTGKGTEIMLSFDAESREEIDNIARKVTEAGGIVFAQPAEVQGWMYGCAFTDLDGHRWNALFMDMSKMKTA